MLFLGEDFSSFILMIYFCAWPDLILYIFYYILVQETVDITWLFFLNTISCTCTRSVNSYNERTCVRFMFIFFFFSFAYLFLSCNGSFDSDIRILCCVDREIILMRCNELQIIWVFSCVFFCRLEFTIEAMNRIGFGLFRFTHCFFGEPSVLSHVVFTTIYFAFF